MRRLLLVFAAALAGSCGASGPTAQRPEPGARSASSIASGAGRAPTLEPRYDGVQQKAIHNSYARDEGLLDQLVYHRARALELDIHDGKWTWPDVPGDWYVYHANAPGLNGTSCTRLSDCLDELRTWQTAFPRHEVTTVFLDIKDDFTGSGHSADELDARLLAGLPPGSIFSPADLLARCPGATSLASAVTGACAWPALAALRGKILFALTGGDLCAASSALDDYAGKGAKAGARVGFIAPGLNDACPLSHYEAEARHAVFFNMDYANVAKATEVHKAGFVGRVYYGGLTGGLDKKAWWDAAMAAGTHFLATDEVNVEYAPWAATHGPLGWPFSCFGPCDPREIEPARLLGMRVSSGDLWGSSDSFDFLYEDGQSGDVAWTALVSAAGSHVEPFAKGCLVARASAEPDAPYFAVCRPADAHPIRTQARTAAGASTSSSEVAVTAADTIDETSVAFVKLEVSGPPAAPTVRGYGSEDGKTWVLVGSATFSSPLPLRGVGASAHGSASPVKLLFAELTRTAGSSKAYAVADFPRHDRIGGATLGQAFDGVSPP